MALDITLKKNNSKLDDIKKSLKAANKQKVEVGYFSSQGKHTGADGISDYSYAALAQALEIGWFPMMKDVLFGDQYRTPMPFMNNIVNRGLQDRMKSGAFTRPAKKWRQSLDEGVSPDLLLNALGRTIVLAAPKVMGNPAYFPQASSNETPNVETSELLNAFSFRTSTNKAVRKK